MEPTKFSLLLKQCRENAGLTQKQISAALNIERSTYAYYECGKTNPSGTFILKLAKVLNIDYTIFIDAIADETPNEDFSTLSGDSWKKREKMYALSEQEQNLILSYRTMSKENRNAIENICKLSLKGESKV